MPDLSSTSSSVLNKTQSSTNHTLNKSSSSILPCDTAPFALDFNPYINSRPATGFR
jgi:hypothetical protein